MEKAKYRRGQKVHYKPNPHYNKTKESKVIDKWLAPIGGWHYKLEGELGYISERHIVD